MLTTDEMKDKKVNVNVNRLRQSYISYYRRTHPNASHQDLIELELGRLMGHSVAQQMDYRKMDQDKDVAVEEENDEDGEIDEVENEQVQ